MVDQVTQVIVGYCGKNQDQEKESRCLPVEKQTGSEKECISECPLSINTGIDQQHDKIESPEEETGEDQRFLRIKKKYVNQEVVQLELLLDI
jgi:hypothetical protein